MMSETVIKVENLYKEYKLGTINNGTLYRDMQSWWAKLRGKEDPNSIISHHHNIDSDKGNLLALNDVSFEVKRGEVLGIIGRNGAGKSTLLKILSRITAPTSGSIKIKGRIGSLLEVGTGFHPELTGRENIYMNGTILGMRKIEIAQKIDEIIAFAEIEKFIDTPVKRYSSGMYVRLAFAVAAHLDPEILVVDEVLAVGDANFQKKCLGKMGEVAKEGRTVIFVSHNMGAVGNICSKALILENGSLDFCGDTVDVIDYYLKSTHLNNGKLNFSQRKNLYHAELYLSDIQLIPSNILKLGDKFSIVIHAEKIVLDELKGIGFMIKNSWGHTITSMNTFIQKKTIGYRDSLVIEFKFNTCQLSIGKYTIDLSYAHKSIGRLDFVENAMAFEVLGNDTMKTDVEFTQYFGTFYPMGEWIEIN